jgi:sugar phosphate isomerase/epimerase
MTKIPNKGGRPAGSRNRLQSKFLFELAEDFEKHGADAIKLCRLEQPATYVKIIASLMPRELEVTAHSVERDLSDEEIAATLEKIRAWRVAAIESAEAIPMKLIDHAKDQAN